MSAACAETERSAKTGVCKCSCSLTVCLECDGWMVYRKAGRRFDAYVPTCLNQTTEPCLYMSSLDKSVSEMSLTSDE